MRKLIVIVAALVLVLVSLGCDGSDSMGVPDGTSNPSDTGQTDTEDVMRNCDDEWTNSQGNVRCCSEAVLTCDTFNFSEGSDGEDPPSTFTPSSDEWIIEYNREDTEIAALTVEATIRRESNQTESITVEGEPDGGRVVVDFSDRSFELGDVLVLNEISVQEACGDQKDFRVGSEVEPAANEAPKTGFDCRLQPEL
jgi:hypothetical protein